MQWSPEGQDTLTYFCRNSQYLNSFLKWSYFLSKTPATLNVFKMLVYSGIQISAADSNVLFNITQEVAQSAPEMFEPRLHMPWRMQSSFQTDPWLKLRATERNSGTIGAAAAGQPVLKQGSVHRRAAITAATIGWIYRWERKVFMSTHSDLYVFTILIYLYKSAYWDIIILYLCLFVFFFY